MPSRNNGSDDVGGVLGMPRVIADRTASDLGRHKVETDAPLAGERVFHVGQPVAVVVAETPAAAADAVEAVEVEYDPLPVAVHVEQALRDGAPRVLPEAMAASDEASAHRAARGSSGGPAAV